MSWLTPRTTTRRPGTPGVVVVLVDVTGSISPANKARIHAEAQAIIRRMPRARILAFGTSVMDITANPSEMTRHTLWGCFEGVNWEARRSNWMQERTAGTNIGKALSAAAAMTPERTMVLSDGGTSDRALMFSVADQMTGAIDAYYCHPVREEFDLVNHHVSADDLWRYYSQGADKSAMQELARRGGGRFEPYPSAKGIYLDYGLREAHPGYPGRQVMKRPTHINGPAVNIRAPQNEVHRVTRRIDVYHQDEIHHHHGEAEHIHHGEQQSVDIEMGKARVNVQRPEGYHIQDHRAPEPPRGFLKTLFFGPEKRPALPPPREEYRGSLQAQPQGRALPAPQQVPRLAPPQGQAIPPGAWVSTKQKVR